jgi:hypothetical protein
VFNIPAQLDQVPIGVKAFLKGKMPPVVPHKAEDKEKITRIFEKVEQSQHKQGP